MYNVYQNDIYYNVTTNIGSSISNRGVTKEEKVPTEILCDNYKKSTNDLLQICENYIKREKEIKKNMSLMYVIKNNNRIVMISDSRSTNFIGNYIDDFKKLVYLPKSEVAFACAGNNIINGITITDYLLNMDEQFADKTVKKILEILDESFKKCDLNSINLCINKFSTKESYYVNYSKDAKLEIIENQGIWKNSTDDVFTKLFVSNNNTLTRNTNMLSETQIVRLFSSCIKMQEIYNEFVLNPNTIGGKIQVMVLDNTGVKEYYVD